MKRIILKLFLISVLLSSAGCGAGGELGVSGAWARPAETGQNSALYFVVDNPTGQADTLLAVRGTAAAALEMHLSRVDENGVVSMERQETVPVPERGTVEFQPGGLHVMLVEVAEPLQPGDRITVYFEFQNAGEIEVEVPVRDQ